MKCLIHDCNNKPKTRGLCRTCYEKAKKYVNSLASTKEERREVWEQLRNEGWCLDCRKDDSHWGTCVTEGCENKEWKDGFCRECIISCFNKTGRFPWNA
ncbi:MAG: hypothetical protein WC919_04050 [Candidatus Paceibacterota bacterium]